MEKVLHHTPDYQTTSPIDFLTTDDGGFLRYGVWPSRTIKKRGSILLLNGRREFMEKYHETIAELNKRAYDVYSFDWRGQGLSSRMLANRHKGFIDSYDTYLRDLGLFVDHIVFPKAVLPLLVLAHSMGGHIALRYLHDRPERVARAVLVSPMIDVVTSPVPLVLVRLMVCTAMNLGLHDAYIMGSGDYDPGTQFEGNRLTSDVRRFTYEKNLIAENPDLALGGVTYGWLAATFESIDTLNRPGFPEKINTPVLIVGAGDDRIVSLSAQRRIADRLKRSRLIEIEDARHEILIEADAIRAGFWHAFDTFLDVSNGGLR
jgi:lysophospholipase